MGADRDSFDGRIDMMNGRNIRFPAAVDFIDPDSVHPSTHFKPKKSGEDASSTDMQNAMNSSRDSSRLVPRKDSNVALLEQAVEAKNKAGTTKIHIAAGNGDIAMIDHLKQLGQDIGVKNNDGATPMHYAARNGQIAMVDHLKQLGQDIGVKNKNGSTPMDNAARSRQIAMVNHLKQLRNGSLNRSPVKQMQV